MKTAKIPDCSADRKDINDRFYKVKVMKKFFAAVLVAFIMCFAFSGCTDSAGPSTPPEQDGGNTTGTGKEEEISTMYITIKERKLEVTLDDNVAVAALLEILESGDIVYTADDYGGFEKVGALGHSLPTDNSQITTQAGDVVLYNGNQIVIFYGSNSWSYTGLGKIKGCTVSELKTFLRAGEGSVQVTLSLK